MAVIELNETELSFLRERAAEANRLEAALAQLRAEVNAACKYFLFSRDIRDGDWSLDPQLRLTKPDNLQEPKQ